MIVFAALCMPVFGQTTAEEWFDKGYDSFQQGKYDEAIKAFDEAIRLDPQYADAWFYKGNALSNEATNDWNKGNWNKGDALGAQDKCNESVKAHDATQDKCNESVKAYDKVIELKPDYAAEAYSQIGEIFTIQGKVNEAVKAYDEVIRLSPNDPDAYTTKAHALERLGKYDEAVKAYDEAIRLDPQFGGYWYAEGIALGKQNKTSEANEAFAKARELKYCG